MGFRSVASVRKRRTIFRLTWQDSPFEIALDDVDQVGTFVELETAADASELAAARERLLSLARRLELFRVERRSYLGLLLSSELA